MAANGISTLPTKQQRQVAKLTLAERKRRGYTLNPDGSILSGSVPDTTAPFFRDNNTYDRTLLPAQYFGGTLYDNSAILIPGRLWSPMTTSTVLTSTIRLEDEDIITLEDETADFAPE
jgi:hypothetical protein